QHGAATGPGREVARVPDQEPIHVGEGRRARGYDALAPGLAAPPAFSAHGLQSSMPRLLQMRQMNVPQSRQGYPSDARSSLPQERQIIASCSRMGVVMRPPRGTTDKYATGGWR